MWWTDIPHNLWPAYKSTRKKAPCQNMFEILEEMKLFHFVNIFVHFSAIFAPFLRKDEPISYIHYLWHAYKKLWCQNISEIPGGKIQTFPIRRFRGVFENYLMIFLHQRKLLVIEGKIRKMLRLCFCRFFRIWGDY